MNLMFNKTLRGCIEGDLEDLKRVSEERAGVGAAG
jgi:hypothetical protein